MIGGITASSAVKAAQVEAVILPGCTCGQAISAHRARDCNGYQASRPITSLGVVAYTNRSRLCRALWSLEFLCRCARLVLERRFAKG